jgi:hypothetical protein
MLSGFRPEQCPESDRNAVRLPPEYAYLRLIEIRLRRAGLSLTAKTAMEQLHHLHSCLVWQEKKKKPARIIEEPTEVQAAILKALGFEVRDGVLQETKS